MKYYECGRSVFFINDMLFKLKSIIVQRTLIAFSSAL